MLKNFIQFSIVFAGMLLLLSPAFGQICVPDTEPDSIGLYPAELPPGTVGEPYEAVLTAVLPESIEQGPNVLDICSARILSTTPDLASIGLSYDCDLANCEIIVDHTDEDSIAYACLVISGTPTAEIDSIQVELAVDAGGYNPATGCNVVIDDLPQAFAVAFSITVNVEEVENTYALRPYWGQDQLHIEWHAPLGQGATVSVLNLQGQVIAKQAASTTQVMSFATTDWATGLYIIRAELEGQVLTEKVVLTR